MFTSTGLLAAAFLAQTVSAATLPPPPITGTCRSVAPVISTLRSYSSRTSFCSSYLGISTQTSFAAATVTVTSTGATDVSIATSTVTNTDTSVSTTSITSTVGTSTLTADTVTLTGPSETVVDHARSSTSIAPVVTTYVATPTTEAPTSTSTVTTTTTTIVCGNGNQTNSTGTGTGTDTGTSTATSTTVVQKRATSTSVQPTKSVPSQFRGFQPSAISSGCKCLSLTTPTTTVTTTATATVTSFPSATSTITTVTSVTTTTTLTAEQDVFASTTSTPLVTSTYRTTTTPILLTVTTPTTTLTPPPVTTTPTTVVTTTVTSTVRAGQAAVQLANPTPITPIRRDGTANGDWDDQTGWNIANIPFPVGLYNVTSTKLIVGINGWVSPGSVDSGDYRNTALPNQYAGDPSWVAYWADLYIVNGTHQGIYYEINGDPGQRTLSIEYFMSFYRAPTAYTHFLINLFENEVGRVVFTYFQTTTLHSTLNPQYGTIGVQSPTLGRFNQYSYDKVPAQGTSIEWRPSTNNWTMVSGASC